MIVVTTNEISGARIARTFGIVSGVIVRSRGIGGNIAAAFKSLGGGEINNYSRLVEESRQQAMERMTQAAHAMGANAIIGCRFDSGEIGETFNEVIAYGTAVVIEPA